MNSTLINRRTLLAGALAGVGVGAGQSFAAQSRTVDPEETIKLQKNHAARVAERGRKTYYDAKRFDLTDLPEYRAQASVSGKLRVWGLNYFTDGKLLQYWEESFRKFHPGVEFEVNTPTGLVAIPALYNGLADLAPNRRITFDEMLAFQRVKGYQPLEITVVTGSYDVPGYAPALGFYVHKDNPLTQLTLEQVDGIFGAERNGGFDSTFAWQPDRGRGPDKNIRTWGQMGLPAPWVDKTIVPYGLTLKYHQQARIESRAFNGGTKWNEKLREYAHFIKNNGEQGISESELMADLGNDRFGIAYCNVPFATSNVKLLRLADASAGPFFELSIDTVRDRSYPMYGEEYIYVDRRPSAPLEPKVREMLRFVLSRQGQGDVARDGKYLPLTAAVVHEQLAKLV